MTASPKSVIHLSKKAQSFLTTCVTDTVLCLLCFLKLATALVDLLFIEHTLRFSNVKQMYLSHEIILRVLITRGRVDF